MKKHIFIFGMLLISVANSFAQTPDRYTISGGILGGANYSKFRLIDDVPGVDPKFKWGFAAGVWVNFPLGNMLSLEIQPQYSRIGTKLESGGTTTFDQELHYVSAPLVLKLHAGRVFAFTLGGQADFLVKAREKVTDVDNEDLLDRTSFGVTGGFELFPRSTVTFYGRYMHGLTRLAKDEATDPQLYNQQIQAGLKFKAFGRRIPGTPPPPPPPVIVDRDGDGVMDTDDKCPDVAGLAALMGCPDRDGDGIADADDRCPDQAGTAKYNGCPIPDTDGDGINDEVDKCPTVKGVERYQGCPIPDTDNDGVNDEEDKCPSIKGTRENNGCPELKATYNFNQVFKRSFADQNVFNVSVVLELL